MGSDFSIQKSSDLPQQQEDSERQKFNRFNSYFQDFTEIHYNEPQGIRKIVLRRQIVLQDHEQVKQMIDNYNHIDKKPFSILYPIEIAEWVGDNSQRLGGFSELNTSRLCAKSSVASVYFEPQTNSLASYCQNKNESSFRTTNFMASKFQELNQNNIWFILNQISHSIEVLRNSKHAHWNITPQTIFCNRNQNWFIHDSYFVIGPNHQNFLQYKFKSIKTAGKCSISSNETITKGSYAIMSPNLIHLLQKGHFVDISSGQSQDTYALGYSLLYAMGAGKTLYSEKDPSKRHEKVISFIRISHAKYSSELLNIIRSMIQPIQSHRISIHSLRQQLKPLERKIISESIIKCSISEDSDQIGHQIQNFHLSCRDQMSLNSQNNNLFHIPGSPSTIRPTRTFEPTQSVMSPMFNFKTLRESLPRYQQKVENCISTNQNGNLYEQSINLSEKRVQKFEISIKINNTARNRKDSHSILLNNPSHSSSRVLKNSEVQISTVQQQLK